jgi:hypothetical protein
MIKWHAGKAAASFGLRKKTMPKFHLILVLTCLLVSCGADVFLPGSTRAPAASSQTPVIVTNPPALTALALLATASMTPTAAPSLTPTASPTATPEPPRLELSILGCDTSLDLAHQMGEVTNAYVLLANTGQSAANNVCALLSSSDEGRQHPDHLGCVLTLPAGYQVTFKLTVDTDFGKDTLIRVDASSAEKVSAKAADRSCRAIGAPKHDLDPFGVIRPIP